MKTAAGIPNKGIPVFKSLEIGQILSYQGVSFKIESKVYHSNRSGLKHPCFTLTKIEHEPQISEIYDARSCVVNGTICEAASDKELSDGSKTMRRGHQQFGTIEHKLPAVDNDATGTTANSGFQTGLGGYLNIGTTSSVVNNKKKQKLILSADCEWEGKKVLSFQISYKFNNKIYYWICIYNQKIQKMSINALLSWFFKDNAQRLGLKEPISEYKKKSFTDAEQLKRYIKANNISIYMVFHYAIADFCRLYGYKKLLGNTDNIQKTISTISYPISLNVYTEDRNYFYPVNIYIRDTYLLMPALGNKALATLGEAVGVPKITLPEEYIKSKMSELLEKDPATFFVYALTDTEIPLKYIEIFKVLDPDIQDIPVTIGSFAAKLFKKKVMNELGISPKEFTALHGYETINDGYNGSYKVVMDKCRGLFETATSSYYGGENVAPEGGICISENEIWNDIDICSAYPTAESLCYWPNWDTIEQIPAGELKRGQIKLNDMAFAWIEFEMPEKSICPFVIRDKKGRGLLNVRTGETFATGPEMYLALELGGKVYIKSGFIVYPYPEEDPKRDLLFNYQKELLEKRSEFKKKYGKGSVQEQLAKTVSNSHYGKMGQGLKDSMSYSTRAKNYTFTPPSAVTCPPIAAHITALVRVLAIATHIEIKKKLKKRVINICTDGLVTNASLDEINSLELFGYKKLFSEARLKLANSPDIFEVKHKQEIAIVGKTRLNMGLGFVKDFKPICAKGGYKLTPEDLSQIATNGKVDRYKEAILMAKKYLERTGKIPNTYQKAPSFKELMEKEVEYEFEDVEKSVNFEYDWKRKPILENAEDITIEIDGKKYKHIHFYTEEWENIEEFDRYRNAFDAYTKRKDFMPIKTVKDLKNFYLFAETKFVYKQTGSRIQRNIDEDIARNIIMAIRKYGASWYVEGKMSGAEAIQKVYSYMNLPLPTKQQIYNIWKKAGIAERQKRINITFIEKAIEDLDIKYEKLKIKPKEVQTFLKDNKEVIINNEEIREVRNDNISINSS